MPYCENCGSPINPNAKFCRNCGAAINSETASPQLSPQPTSTPTYPSPPQPMQTAPAPMPIAPQPNAPAPLAPSESVIGVLLFKREKSFGRWETYNGVMTSQRLILAQMTNDMMKAAIQQARDQAKAEGKGFWGQWGDQMKATYGYSRKYLSMEPSAILAETPGNFELGNGTISEIKLHEQFKREEQGVYEFKVEIHSSAGKYEFLMDQNGDYVNLLKQVYGERVKTPLGYFSKKVNIKL